MEVIIRFLEEKGDFVAYRPITYLQVEPEGKYLLTQKVEYASVFKSIKGAQRVIERKSFLEWSMSKPKYEIVEVPSKRLELEPDERIVFFNDGSMFNKEKLGIWEQVAVKEIDYIEATELFAKSMPTKGNPTFYCWEENFFCDGSIKTLYGICAENGNKFIVNHLMGGFMTVPHCGKYRVVNSGYRMPVKMYSGEIQWVNPREYFDLIKNGPLEKKDVKPAFETDLNLEAFLLKVDEIKGRGY